MTATTAKRSRHQSVLLLGGVCLLALVAVGIYRHLFGGHTWSRSSPWMLVYLFLFAISFLVGGLRVDAGIVRRRVSMTLLGVGLAFGILAMLFDAGIL